MAIQNNKIWNNSLRRLLDAAYVFNRQLERAVWLNTAVRYDCNIEAMVSHYGQSINLYFLNKIEMMEGGNNYWVMGLHCLLIMPVRATSFPEGRHYSIVVVCCTPTLSMLSNLWQINEVAELCSLFWSDQQLAAKPRFQMHKTLLSNFGCSSHFSHFLL